MTVADDLRAARQTYIVEAYHRTTRFVSVQARDEAEAVRLVREGQGHCYDSEPGPDVFRPKWTARLPFTGERTW